MTAHSHGLPEDFLDDGPGHWDHYLASLLELFLDLGKCGHSVQKRTQGSEVR